MTNATSKAAALWLGLLCGLIGCKAEHEEATREVVEQGVEVAKQGVEQAKQGVEVAKQEIAEARERYEVDERVAAARDRFNTGMDEAADDFGKLAEAGREQANKLGEAIDDKREAGLEGAAEAIDCEPASEAAGEGAGEGAKRRCTVAGEFVERLKNEPKLLARELMLLPSQGETGQGLELVKLGDRSVAELLGLDRNDILLEINGVPLDSLESIRSIDEALADKSAAELVYERNGERRTLVIQRK